MGDIDISGECRQSLGTLFEESIGYAGLRADSGSRATVLGRHEPKALHPKYKARRPCSRDSPLSRVKPHALGGSWGLSK